MRISFPEHGKKDFDEELRKELNEPVGVTGSYEKDPDLDLALVGDDSILPERTL